MLAKKHGIEKIITILFILVALLVSSATTSLATGTYSQLANFPVVHQSKSNWCWAACGEAILQYYGNTNVYQQDFVFYVKYGDLSDNPGDFDEITAGLSHWNVSSSYNNYTYSFNNIITDIFNNTRPVLIRWAWQDSGGNFLNIGHDVIICGYNSYDQYVVYMNPESYQLEYDTYANVVYDSSENRYWTHTMFGFS